MKDDKGFFLLIPVCIPMIDPYLTIDYKNFISKGPSPPKKKNFLSSKIVHLSHFIDHIIISIKTPFFTHQFIITVVSRQPRWKGHTFWLSFSNKHWIWRNLYLSFVEEQGGGESSRVRLRFPSENCRKNVPCGADPMHGGNNKDGSQLKNENWSIIATNT